MDSASGNEEERLNKNLAFLLVRAFLGIVGNGLDVTLWGASRLSVGVKLLKCYRVSAENHGLLP